MAITGISRELIPKKDFLWGHVEILLQLGYNQPNLYIETIFLSVRKVWAKSLKQIV